MKRKKLGAVIEHLRQTAGRLEIVYTAAALDAMRLVKERRKEEWSLILCAGGDGTINEAVNGLMGEEGPTPRPPLGILPTGTGNALAREIGLPLHPWKAYQALLSGTPRPIFLGKVILGTCAAGPRYFVLLAGAGFDGYVSRRVEQRTGLYRNLPKLWIYFLFGIAGLFTYSHPPLRFSMDGRFYTGSTGIIAKAKLIAKPFVFSPSSSIQSRALTLCLLKSQGILGPLRVLVHLLLWRKPGGAVHYIEGTQIEVLEGPGEVQADGEFLGGLPAIFTTAERQIDLIHPAEKT